jgi:hypothetical protein
MAWYPDKPGPTPHPALIHINIGYPLPLTPYLAAPEAAPSPFGSRAIKEDHHGSDKESLD